MIMLQKSLDVYNRVLQIQKRGRQADMNTSLTWKDLIEEVKQDVYVFMN